jgi:hypothetical protein
MGSVRKISTRHQEVYIKTKFLVLPLGGLHEKHTVQRGIWVPTQHLLWGQGKPRKTLIELAGRRTFRMQLTSSQQSGIKYASPNTSLYLCFVPLFFSLKTFTSCFYKNCIYIIWISTKSCITPVEGINACRHKYAYNYNYICNCDS